MSLKIRILFVFLLFSSQLFAQINVYSPYSRFGLGDMVLQGNARTHAMGGMGLALRDANHINFINPAAGAEQDTLSFLFDAGLNGSYNLFSSNTETFGVNNAGLSHIAMGFPVKPWYKSSIGLVPYSRVGYKIADFSLEPGIGIVDYFYDGSGGLNKVFWSNSIKLVKGLTLGMNASYLFGSLTQNRTVSISEENSYTTESRGRVIINDFHFTYGLQYGLPVFKNSELIAAVIYEPAKEARAFNDMFIENVLRTSTFTVRDTVLNSTGENGVVNLPSNLGVGVVLRQGNRFIVGADFYTQDWSQTRILNQTDSLISSNSIRVGGQFLPNPADFRNVFARIQYRMGFHYTQTYLKIRGEQLTDYGLTFGLGLPFRNTKTTFNLSADMGRRGTLSQNLIKENYFNFSFSLSLYDFWFFKRRID